jgi:hypothetical protein
VGTQDDAAATEGDALLLQHDPLRQHARYPRPKADPALGVDDAVPGQVRRAPLERPTHRARRAGPAEQRRDLPVGRDLPARDLPDEAVDRAPEG